MHLIQDVQPYESPAYMRGYGKTAIMRDTPTEDLITEIHKRGTTIEQVFAQFYALEAMADGKHDELFGNGEDGQHGRPLTVGDVELAGLASLPEVPNPRPF